ncbi:8907_t:CDS:2 [Entrophospora sp. SA101]|nr:8907_t:CDS:2 [Entrophospora sp. SA101]
MEIELKDGKFKELNKLEDNLENKNGRMIKRRRNGKLRGISWRMKRRNEGPVNELLRLAKEYAEDIEDAYLKKSLENPFIFNISFENGTPLNLNLMLKHHKISHQDMSVFLIVDGLQTTLQDGEDSHNKTIETLQDVLVHYRDLDVVNFTDLVSDVQTKATGLIQESCKTNSYALKDSMMQCENGQIDVLEHRHCIINYCNAPAGDSFCGIREHQKAGDENDYFILFTTGRYTANLTWLSGVVDMDAWDAYFGSFSGKAFRYPPPVANRATFSELTGVNRIGEIQANMIIQKCPYNNLNDCYQKQTQLGL